MQAMRSLEGSAAGAAETVQVQQQAAARRLEDFDSEVGRYCSQRQARQQRHGHPQQQQQQRVDDMCEYMSFVPSCLLQYTHVCSLSAHHARSLQAAELQMPVWTCSTQALER